MLSRRLVSGLVGSVALLMTSMSYAKCGKDTDCKGERVCEAGQCVAGRTAPPATIAAPATAAAPAAAAVAPAAAAPASAADANAPSPEKPKMQRHSTGMMAGGIVMISLSPVALLVSGIAALGKGLCGVGDHDRYDTCDDRYNPTIYGALVSAVILVGVGVPLLVVGAKKEPVDASATATVSPWLTPSAAGLGLRIDM